MYDNGNYKVNSDILSNVSCQSCSIKPYIKDTIFIYLFRGKFNPNLSHRTSFKSFTFSRINLWNKSYIQILEPWSRRWGIKKKQNSKHSWCLFTLFPLHLNNIPGSIAYQVKIIFWPLSEIYMDASYSP